MAETPIPRWYGDDYQALYFWIRAGELFHAEDTHVSRVGFEVGPRAFDDVVVWYTQPILDWDGRSIDAEYHQVKFHVTHVGAFTWKALMDPAFVNATRSSILTRLAEAAATLGDKAERARFYFHAPWAIEKDDPLKKLVRLDRDGALDTAALKEGATRRSQMGKVRAEWANHLKVSDESQLMALLRLLRIKPGLPDFQDLKRQLNSELAAAGLTPADLAGRTNPYPALIRRLRAEGRLEFTRDELRSICEKEGLWRGLPGQTTERDRAVPPSGEPLQADLLHGIDTEVHTHTDLLIEIRDRLRAAPASTEAPRAPETPGVIDPEAALAVRVDRARDLIKAGKIEAARELLLDLRTELKGTAASKRLLFRIASNLGTCSLSEENLATARDEYTAALELQPDDPTALANAALLALLSGDLPGAERLSREARTKGPRDPNALAVFLQVLVGSGRREELAAVLSAESWIETAPACAGALGWVALQQGDYTKAEARLRPALVDEPRNARMIEALALSILEPIDASLADETLVSWGLPGDVRERLAEADDLLTRAAGLFRDRHSPAAASDTLVRRAHVRHLLGRPEDGLADCSEALSLSPANESARVERGVILLAEGRPKDALADLRMISSERRRTLALPIGAAFLALGDTAEALAALDPLWPASPSDPARYKILDLLLEALRRMRATSRAEELVGNLARDAPDDPDALIIRARHAGRTGDTELAESLFRQALERATGTVRKRVSLEFADYCHAKQDFGRAADAYAEAVDATRDTAPTRKYLISLYNAGRFEKALTVARTLRGNATALPVVSEIEALILEFCADTDAARGLWQGLHEAEPEKVSHRIRIALLDARTGRETDARNAIEALRIEDLSSDPQSLMQVAQARQLLGLPDVLPFAYEAWRVGNHDPEIHLAYIGLFMAREHDEALDSPPEAQLNFAVRLLRDGKPEVVTLLPPGRLVRLAEERAADDPMTAKLLGHKKGDRVLLREGLIRDVEVEIAEIQHPYVFAFQLSLAAFSSRFPEHGGIESFQVTEQDVTPIFATVEAREKGVSKALEFYGARQLTIGAFAQLSGRSVFETWGFLMGSPARGVRASFGELAEVVSETQNLSEAKSVVLDLTALLTLGHLGLLEKVSLAFPIVLVPRPVLEELQTEIAKLTRGPKTADTLGKEGDRYVMQHFSPEHLDALAGFLRKLVAFVDGATMVVPVTLAADLGRDRFMAVAEALGRSAISSVLVAKERGAVLYADDVLLRLLARNEHGVKGAWTQTFLEVVRERGLLDVTEYSKALRVLIRSNYRFVRLGRDDFRQILRADTYQLTEDVRGAFRSLEGPDCSIESAAQIVADLVRDVWVEVQLPEQRAILLDYLLATLTAGRRASSALHLLRQLLPSRFALLPAQLREVLNGIGLWQGRGDG